jgi:hypothetical protein
MKKNLRGLRRGYGQWGIFDQRQRLPKGQKRLMKKKLRGLRQGYGQWGIFFKRGDEATGKQDETHRDKTN